MILDRIVTQKRRDVAERKTAFQLDSFIHELQPSSRNFRDIAGQRHPGLITEFKRKSPSENQILSDRTLQDVVKIYDENPFVKALSILTDSHFFGGSVEDLRTAAELTSKPILRKDFIIDPYQIYEARYYGADAILLIARILSREELITLSQLAASLAMDVLFEIHDQDDLAKVPANARIIGINNRNLDTLTIDLNTTQKLSRELSDRNVIIVSESGIHDADDIRKIHGSAHAALIGTSILKAGDMDRHIRAFFRPKIKVCGMTNREDAIFTAEAGADYLGFVFHRKSPRFVAPPQAATMALELKSRFPRIRTVAVFGDEDPDYIRETFIESGCDLCQCFTVPEGLGSEKLIQVHRIRETLTPLPEDFQNRHACLLDSYHEKLAGGSGITFSWEKLPTLPKHTFFFVAGGINSSNISDLLAYVPDGVDLSSSLETTPGTKDHEKVRQFFRIIDEQCGINPYIDSTAIK